MCSPPSQTHAFQDKHPPLLVMMSHMVHARFAAFKTILRLSPLLEGCTLGFFRISWYEPDTPLLEAQDSMACLSGMTTATSTLSSLLPYTLQQFHSQHIVSLWPT